ncbi:MAG TPA: Hpt domain-containing protein [Burkholderiales bacterium]|nr:Hpt domain-containing protein [Burkholderiales bacterium]
MNDFLLDTSALDRIRALHRGSGSALLRKVIELYLAESRTLLDSLRFAASAGDAPGLQWAAHTLKSSSANLGAVELARQCGELETAARNRALAGTIEIIQKIESGHRDVCAALEREGA